MEDNKDNKNQDGGRNQGKVQNNGKAVDWSNGHNKQTYRPSNDNSGTPPPPKDKKE